VASTQQQTLSHVFPLGSRINERGRLEIGGCDTIELAKQFGTPAYVVAEDDLRARAQAFKQAHASRHGNGEIVFASKAFPATAVLRLFAEEGLGCDVASAGELHLALRAGFDPARLVLHGNAKSTSELVYAISEGVGLIVIDNLDEIDRLATLVAPRAAWPVMLRITPGVDPVTHHMISTGQADSKFGFSMQDAPAAIERIRAVQSLQLVGLHMHIGSQLFELEHYREAIAALATLGEFSTYDLGGGLGVAYTAEDEPPTIEEWVGGLLAAARGTLGLDKRILLEPGRALVANGVVTLYTVVGVKRNVSTWVAVDGGMSDNMRPMLYGSRYEAYVADRLVEGNTRCHLTGKHCESGDVIVRDALLENPRRGDVIVTPATGAYGHAMANNYNGIPRPPVIFCRDGDARVVVRRETFEDLEARDVGRP
jgi:diaminopimelate decarboxylase